MADMDTTDRSKSNGGSDEETKPYADLEKKVKFELESLWTHWRYNASLKPRVRIQYKAV